MAPLTKSPKGTSTHRPEELWMDPDFSRNGYAMAHDFAKLDQI